MLVREHRRLAEVHPDALRHALAPLLDVLAAELDAAARAGVVVTTDPARDAQTIFGLVLEGINDVTTGRADPLEHAGYLWQFCFNGLHARADTSKDPGGS